MKLWLISQEVNRDWDTYDSCVVAAETEEEARKTHPSDGRLEYSWKEDGWYHGSYKEFGNGVWAPPSVVTVRLIGEAVDGTKPGVICASFNAG